MPAPGYTDDPTCFFQAVQDLQQERGDGPLPDYFDALVHFLMGYMKCAIVSGITADEYEYVIGGLTKFVPEVMFLFITIYIYIYELS